MYLCETDSVTKGDFVFLPDPQLLLTARLPFVQQATILGCYLDNILSGYLQGYSFCLAIN